MKTTLGDWGMVAFVIFGAIVAAMEQDFGMSAIFLAAGGIYTQTLFFDD